MASRERARGQEASDWELSVVTGQIRRTPPLDFGEGARAAVARRQQAGRGEEARRREQTAHYLAHVQGRGVRRAEEIFV